MQTNHMYAALLPWLSEASHLVLGPKSTIISCSDPEGREILKIYFMLLGHINLFLWDTINLIRVNGGIAWIYYIPWLVVISV